MASLVIAELSISARRRGEGIFLVLVLVLVGLFATRGFARLVPC